MEKKKTISTMPKICYSAQLDNMLDDFENNWGYDCDIWAELELEPTYELDLVSAAKLFTKAIKKKSPIFVFWNSNEPTCGFGTLKELKARFQKFEEKMKREDEKNEIANQIQDEKQKSAKIKQLEAELKELKELKGK